MTRTNKKHLYGNEHLQQTAVGVPFFLGSAFPRSQYTQANLAVVVQVRVKAHVAVTSSQKGNLHSFELLTSPRLSICE